MAAHTVATITSLVEPEAIAVEFEALRFFAVAEHFLVGVDFF